MAETLTPAAVMPTPLLLSSRRRHTMCSRDWSSAVYSSDPTTTVQPTTTTTTVQPTTTTTTIRPTDRKSVVQGKSADLGGRRIIKKKKQGTNKTKRRAQATKRVSSGTRTGDGTHTARRNRTV